MFRVSILFLTLAVAGCGGDDMPMDGSASDMGCSSDLECDDGVFCDGTERCVAGQCAAGDAPCAVADCREAERICVGACEDDADGDGSRSMECGGDDCDDDDPDRYPGNTEICDPEGVDEDCDPSTFGERDTDEDGEIDSACCNGNTCGTDCDDSEPAVFEGTSETCNDRDDDCDGMVDEGLTLVRTYPDEDEDGFGDESNPMDTCAAPPGNIPAGGDCDDGNAEVRPDQTEYFEEDRGDGSFDYNCDGDEEALYVTPESGVCSDKDVFNCGSDHTPGYRTAMQPACGTEFAFAERCSVIAITCQLSQRMRTQTCR